MDFLKRAFINKIVDDLITLNGTEFEYFCKPIFEIIIGESAIHKGSNLFAKPISRTVDFSTNNFEVVGQCGTDNDYFGVFSGNFDDILKLKIEDTKPIKDISSALKNSEQCSKIILFSNQEAKAGRLDKVNKTINHFGIKQDVEVYDSEGIANIIVENIGNQRFIFGIIDYLPTASQVYSALSMQNELPPLPHDYVIRAVENSVIEIIKQHKVSVIHGVSGIGKSKTALGVAHRLINEFDSVIWVNLGEKKEFDFKSVKIGDFDKNLNLAHLCSTYKTLVILDNFFGDSAEIESIFQTFAKEDSRVLITSLERSSRRENSFHLSEMTIDEAKQLINKSIDIDDRYIDEIIETIGGHPLCLELVCQIINEEEYNDNEIAAFLKEIEAIPHEIVRGKSQTISDLIIGKYAQKFIKEFTLIALLDAEQVSNYIFNKIIGMRAIRNLERGSLIVRSGLNYSTIHSIVLLSIKNLIGECHEKNALKEKVCEVLSVDNEYKNSDYYSFCVIHNDLLQNLYKDNLCDKYKKTLLYAIIQITDNLVFKSDLINEIDKFDLSNNELEDLLLLIEKSELKLISIDKKISEEYYQEQATEVIEKLTEINTSIPEESNLKLLIEHHIAKIYYWKRDNINAKKIFKGLLSKYPSSEQCMLQLARIYDNEKEYPEAEKLIDIVLGNSNYDKQSYSVILSFYDLISNSRYNSFREKYIENRCEDFVSTISATLRSSFDHPYRVLSSLSSYLGYNLPKVFESLCSNLPAPDNVSKNKKLMIAYADIQFALYRLYKYKPKYEGQKPKLTEISKLAEQYYIEAEPTNDYENMKVAKFYIETEQYSNAGVYLEKINSKDAFYYQTSAKQLRGVNNSPDALAAIGNAIEAAKKGECNKMFLPSFLNDKAEILKQTDVVEALKILTEAIELEKNFKTRAAWQQKMQVWNANLSKD